MVWRDSVRDVGAPLPPLQPVDRSAERTVEIGGKGDGLHMQVSELFSIGECDQAVMDFLAATEVGKFPRKVK